MSQFGKGKNESDITKSSTNYSDCEKCGGSGYVIERMLMSTFWERYRRETGPYLYGDKDWEDFFAVPCPKCSGGKDRQAELKRKHANIPNVFYNKRYADFDWSLYSDTEDMKREAQRSKLIVDSFINQFEKWEEQKKGLYIWNRTKGSGKTFLASCICNELISTICIGTKFVRASDLLEISKAEYPNEKLEEDRKPIKWLYSCKLLVIDDLGQKNCGLEWMNDVLFNILDERQNKGRVTIITSNMAPDDLPFDDRSLDRLNAMCHPIELPKKGVRSLKARNDTMQLFKELGLIKNENNA